MKKFLIFIGIIAVVAIALMATTPDKQQHQEAIKSVFVSAVNAELRENHIDGAVGSIATAAAITGIDAFLNHSLIIRDHRFFNIGVIDYEGEFQMISVGAFNHVWTLNEDQVRQIIKKKMKTLAL